MRGRSSTPTLRNLGDFDTAFDVKLPKVGTETEIREGRDRWWVGLEPWLIEDGKPEPLRSGVTLVRGVEIAIKEVPRIVGPLSVPWQHIGRSPQGRPWRVTRIIRDSTEIDHIDHWPAARHDVLEPTPT